jgi:hypothetical protein
MGAFKQTYRNRNRPHSIGFSGRQRSLDCQRCLPLYFPCAPSSQLRHLPENNLNNISSLKIYRLIRGNLFLSGYYAHPTEHLRYAPYARRRP